MQEFINDMAKWIAITYDEGEEMRNMGELIREVRELKEITSKILDINC